MLRDRIVLWKLTHINIVGVGDLLTGVILLDVVLHVDVAVTPKQFYQLARKRLARDGAFVTQATSPFYAKQAFWSIAQTLEQAGFSEVHPYHAHVPSFGDWGFVLATDLPGDPAARPIRVPTRYLDTPTLATLFHFAADERASGVESSTLAAPKVLDYYLKGWKDWR